MMANVLLAIILDLQLPVSSIISVWFVLIYTNSIQDICAACVYGLYLFYCIVGF